LAKTAGERTNNGDKKMLRDFFLGFVKVHLLHHASRGPVYGVWFIEELARHGYHRSRSCASSRRPIGCWARGKDVADVCRELQVSEQTYYRWRNQFGGLKADDAKRLKVLERENSTLKRLLADAELEKAALKEIARGNF
jgi:putative transposase